MTALDWLALLHPVLMILFVYPVVGATIRLGILVRERRLQINPLPPTVPVEHTDHGRWVTTGTVVAVLIALLWSFLDHAEAGVPFLGGVGRLVRLLLLGGVALAGCGALWRLRRPGRRTCSALLSWGALLARRPGRRCRQRAPQPAKATPPRSRRRTKRPTPPRKGTPASS